LDGRRDEKTEYWLKHIESFGGESPVLVMLNKIDENPSHDVNRVALRKGAIGILLNSLLVRHLHERFYTPKMSALKYSPLIFEFVRGSEVEEKVIVTFILIHQSHE
jgi:hypothetical protein